MQREQSAADAKNTEDIGQKRQHKFKAISE